MTAPAVERARVRARVEGTVQGVGFRPYVYRLAGELELDGFVSNDERGVLLEVEGAPQAVRRFLERLPREAPPMAAVERVRSEPVPAGRGRGFAILESARRTRRRATRAWRSSSTRPTAATATRSSTARRAARGSRSCAASRTTAR